MVHISKNQDDFLTLHPIMPCSINRVGGSSISTIGMENIKLRIAQGTLIILKDALYVPNAAVHLIFVSYLSRDSNVVAHFDDSSWIMNKSTGACIAQGPLLPQKRLYSLDISAQAEHALAVHNSPDLETWHCHLGHINYQSLLDMEPSSQVHPNHPP